MRSVAIYRHQQFVRSETFIAAQARALRRFSPVYVGRSVSTATDSDLPLITLHSRSARVRHALLKDVTPFIEPCRARGVQLVHAHFGVEGVYALNLVARLRVPLITTFHGFDATITTSSLLRSGKVSWLHYARGRQALARSGTLFLCVSEFIRQQVLALGFPPERTVTHYIGIDCDTIKVDSVPATTNTIVHIARLVEFKGTRVLIDAFARLAHQFSSARLVIVGDGPLRADLERRAAATGVGDRIRFLGAQPHAQAMAELRKASVFCLPSLRSAQGQSEGLGMVTLEAAALSIPVVGTRNGGIPEVVDDGNTGFLVPPGDAPALADRLGTLLGQTELRNTLGRAARLRVEQHFNLRRQTARLEDLYESVL